MMEKERRARLQKKLRKMAKENAKANKGKRKRNINDDAGSKRPRKDTTNGKSNKGKRKRDEGEDVSEHAEERNSKQKESVKAWTPPPIHERRRISLHDNELPRAPNFNNRKP